MINIVELLVLRVTQLRFIPLLIVFYTHKKRSLLKMERDIWIQVIKDENTFSLRNFIWLLTNLPEYRSVLYLRLGRIGKILRYFAKGRESLYLNIDPSLVGEGLVIQHGFSTIVGAVSIGRNCQIWQNVTIGTNKSKSGNKAIIGNNVKISAGAIVLGKITIGDNVTIGAGAVIVKDVPENCVVVGNPAYIIKRNGESVRIKL